MGVLDKTAESEGSGAPGRWLGTHKPELEDRAVVASAACWHPGRMMASVKAQGEVRKNAAGEETPEIGR